MGDPSAGIPLWHRALFMPGAKQVGHLTALMNSITYAPLRPNPQLIALQPGDAAPEKLVLGASTEAKDLTLVYNPQERAVDISLEAMPQEPKVTWFNPRTGQSTPAVAVVGGAACQFPTPEGGRFHDQ